MKTDNITAEEKYEVISDYPQGVFKFNKGDILVKKGIHYCNDVKSITESEIVKYPHIFKPL